MNNIKFKLNKGNIKSNKYVIEDYYLNQLVIIFTSNIEYLTMLKFTRNLFYVGNMQEFNEIVSIEDLNLKNILKLLRKSYN